MMEINTIIILVLILIDVVLAIWLFLKRKPKPISVQFRHHNTMMYLVYSDGSIYAGDPDHKIPFTKVDTIP